MPVVPVDTHRFLKIHSPLGKDLLLHAFKGKEKLGRLYHYELDLRSTNPNIQFEDIVGQRVTVDYELGEANRYFDGFVTSFQFTEEDGQFASYKATVKPWLWFLTQTADCRIFQNQKVPEIIKSVFRGHGMSNFKDSLRNSYRKWDYCVQYRETDFDFVSRLMEREGIYYYFEHSKGKHVLVLADSLAAHDVYPGYETVPYYSSAIPSRLRERDHLQKWTVTQAIKPGKLALTDYDFQKPEVDLKSKVSQDRPHASPLHDSEIFDYPGGFDDFDQGDIYADIRLQEIQARHETVKASGNARGMNVGSLFTLGNYPREDQNKQYLIVSVRHAIKSDEFETTEEKKELEGYRCALRVLDCRQPFRSERITSKPVVKGPQSAVVVGPDDEEIYCDEYGRVKVQFHWDRYGENDQNSSCWIRVSQAWAGKGWGSIHTPRIGQEVLVSFLEGDPDRPVITGRVYNAKRMPPYELEANKTQSGFKSRSSSGGNADSFNEIRMEDKHGSEELYIQAQKNETILVRNDKSETVGHNESVSIGFNRTESVGNDESLGIANSRNVSVGANQDFRIGASESKAVGANQTLSVGGDSSVIISGTHSEIIGGLHGVNVGDSAQLTIASSYDISAGQTINITAGTTISLTAGGSMIEIGPKGVTIQTGGIINLVGSLIKLN